MGARGPKPTPTSTLEARGSWRAKSRPGEPKPKRGRPKCPPQLDDEAKKKWKQLLPELDRLGLLTLIDGDSLAAYCQAWSEFIAATVALRTDGRFHTVNGLRKPHPAIAAQRSAMTAIERFAALFGLNPSARGRISVDAPPRLAEEGEAKGKARFFGPQG